MKNKGWRKSAQGKIFWLVMPSSTITIILLGLIWILTSKAYVESSIINSQKQMLGAMIQYTDVILENVDENINSVTEDSDMISLAAVPDLSKYSQNRRLMLKLNAMQETGYIDTIAIYLPWLDAVFDGDMKIHTFESCNHYEVISSFLENYSEDSGYGSGKHDSSRLFLSETGDFYVLRCFPRGGRTMMYVVAVKLDNDAILEKFSENLDYNSSTLMLVAPDNTVLLSSEQEKIGEKYNWDNQKKLTNPGTSKENKTNDLINWDSSAYSGITFIIKTHDAFNGWARRTLPGTSLIFVILIACLQFILSGIAAARVFKPIEKFINHVITPKASKKRPESSNSDFGYLSKAYEEILEQRESTGQAIGLLQNAVVKKCVRANFNHEGISELEQQEIDELLSITKKDQFMYFPVLIHTIDSSALPFDDVERDNTFIELGFRRFLGDALLNVDAEMLFVSVDAVNQIYLISFNSTDISKEEAVAAIRSAIDELKSIADEGIRILFSGNPVSFQELGKELSCMRIQVSHMLLAEKNDIPGLQVTPELYQEFSKIFEYALQSLFEKRDSNPVSEALQKLSGSVVDSHFRVALYVFFDVLSKYSESASLHFDSLQDIIALSTKECLEFIESGAEKEACIQRSLLAVKTINRLLNESQAGASSDSFKRIIEYISTHYQDPDMGLDSVAQAMNLTCSYLSRYFKEYMGVNYVSYVNSLRIENAQYLLIRTEKSINKIAENVGFTTVQNFNRVFKQLTNYTPGAYRYMMRENVTTGNKGGKV